MPRSGIMLCYPFEEKRLLKWVPPFIVQPKLDGERCRAFYGFGRWTLVSSEQNEILSVPHIINDLEKQLGQNPTIELDGELYCHNLPFCEIHSIVGRTVNLHPDFQRMEYHVFDVVEDQAHQVSRLVKLNKLKLKLPLFMVPHIIAFDLEDVLRAYDKFIEQGYEGIVVRHYGNLYVRKRSTFLMKFKPKKSDWYTITGYKEEVDKDGFPKNRLGSIECMGDDGTKFHVGSGLTDEQREVLWKTRESLPGRLCHVQYQHLTEKHIPRFPVFVDIWKEGEENEIL